MKIFVVLNDDHTAILSAHFNKEKADKRIEGLRNRDIQEVEVEGDLEVFVAFAQYSWDNGFEMMDKIAYLNKSDAEKVVANSKKENDEGDELGDEYIIDALKVK